MSRGTQVFIIRKFLEVILTVLIVTMISFGLMKLSPVDAATAYLQRNQTPVTTENLERVRSEMGLDRPLTVQYWNWLKNAVQGDFGKSYVNSKAVLPQELSAFSFTARVIFLAGLLEAVLIILIGCLCYLCRNRISGYLISALCFAAISIPPFFLASQYIDVIVVKMGLGLVVGNTGLMRFLPAALCFVPGTSAFFGPLFATNIAAQMSMDSADYARCRGLSEKKILLCHAVPSALISIIPSFFQMLALNLAGAIVIEQIFSIPGLGYLILSSVTNRDPPVISDDGYTLTLHLRKGVKFHDGEDFNSEAVKANILDMQNSPASYSLPTIGTVQNIECPDEHTIVLSYENPYYGLLTDLCWPDVMAMVSPKQIEAKNAGEEVSPVGTGPYIYTDYVKGEYTRFVRNDDYWDGTPYYDEVVAKYIPDGASRVQALKNGEVDLLYGASELSYDQYTQLLQTPGMAGKMPPVQARSRNLTLNFNGILGDAAIREAVALSIDKDAISQGMSYGYEPVTDTVLTPGSLYEDECPKVSYSYDPEKAMQILEDAGWTDSNGDGIRDKDGQSLSFVCTIPSEYVENNTIALLIQDMLNEVGMKMEIKPMENNDWFQSFYDPSSFDMTIQDTYYDYASPTQWFGAIEYMAQGISLPLLEDSETFMNMIHEFKTIDDEARLIEIFQYLVAQDQDQFLDIPLTGMMEPIVYNTSKIEDYQYGGVYTFFNPLWITPAE